MLNNFCKNTPDGPLKMREFLFASKLPLNKKPVINKSPIAYHATMSTSTVGAVLDFSPDSRLTMLVDNKLLIAAKFLTVSVGLVSLGSSVTD